MAYHSGLANLVASRDQCLKNIEPSHWPPHRSIDHEHPNPFRHMMSELGVSLENSVDQIRIALERKLRLYPSEATVSRAYLEGLLLCSRSKT